MGREKAAWEPSLWAPGLLPGAQMGWGWMDGDEVGDASCPHTGTAQPPHSPESRVPTLQRYPTAPSPTGAPAQSWERALRAYRFCCRPRPLGTRLCHVTGPGERGSRSSSPPSSPQCNPGGLPDWVLRAPRVRACAAARRGRSTPSPRVSTCFLRGRGSRGQGSGVACVP